MWLLGILFCDGDNVKRKKEGQRERERERERERDTYR